MAAPCAQGATPWSIVMYSDHGDWIGGGEQRRFDSGNATLQVLLNEPRFLTFRLDSPSTDEYYQFDLEVPPGKVLARGVYEPGGLNVGGSGRSCNGSPGRFEILDIAVAASGELSRLWLVYEQHCEGRPQALFGEVRIGAPASPVTPAIVRWPVSDVGQVDTAVPVLVRPQGEVAGVSISGPSAGQFQISADQCTGKMLGGGAGCTASVRHVPTTPGTHFATLRVAKRGGGAEEASLQAFAFGGTTRFAYVSDPGDWVGGGGRGEYTPSNVVIWPLWTLDHVRVFIDGIRGINGNSFLAEFSAAPGEPFAPGTYAGATRWPFNEPNPGLSVTGFGHGCNTLTGQFTVSEIAFDAFGRIMRFGAAFEQHCDGAPPALRGELLFRLGDTTPLAPWMRIGPITSIQARDPRSDQRSGGKPRLVSSASALGPVRARARRDGSIRMSVRVARPGVLTAKAMFGASKPRLYGRVRREVMTARVVRFLVRPRKFARGLIRERRRFVVRIRVKVTEANGAVTAAAPRRVVVRSRP